MGIELTQGVNVGVHYWVNPRCLMGIELTQGG